MVLDGHGVALHSGCPGCILPSWQCRSSRCSWSAIIYLLRVFLTQPEDVAVKASSQVTAAKPVNHSSPTIKFSPVCGIRATSISVRTGTESQDFCPRHKGNFYFDPTAASAVGMQFLKGFSSLHLKLLQGCSLSENTTGTFAGVHILELLCSAPCCIGSFINPLLLPSASFGIPRT